MAEQRCSCVATLVFSVLSLTRPLYCLWFARNDKWWMSSSAYLLPPLLKRLLWRKELVDDKMLPVSTKLVIGFRQSSAEIGENLRAIWFPVWCKQKGSAKWIGVLEVSNLRSLPCSVPAEDVPASPSCRQRHNSNRWWRVWNRFVLFHLTCLCVQCPTLWLTCFSSTKVRVKNRNGRLKSFNLFILLSPK